MQDALRKDYRDDPEVAHIDLINHPELANQPKIAALIFTQFMKDRESRIRGDIKKQDWASARAAVNGRNGDTYLPNGLENFVPALQKGRRHNQVQNAKAQKPDVTVGDVARAWTNGDPAGDQDAYIQGLQKALGIDLNTKFSELTPAQLRQVEGAQTQLIHQVVARDLQRMRSEALALKATVEAKNKQKRPAKAGAGNHPGPVSTASPRPPQ